MHTTCRRWRARRVSLRRSSSVVGTGPQSQADIERAVDGPRHTSSQRRASWSMPDSCTGTAAQSRADHFASAARLPACRRSPGIKFMRRPTGGHDVLWGRQRRPFPASGNLRRPHPASGEQACASLPVQAAEQVRAGGQPQDRQGARARRAGDSCSARADEVIE